MKDRVDSHGESHQTLFCLICMSPIIARARHLDVLSVAFVSGPLVMIDISPIDNAISVLASPHVAPGLQNATTGLQGICI
jgi:hypothetical protein